MATKVTKYSSNFLKAIGSLLTLNDNFPYFSVEPGVRSNIINLGIRKYKRPYKRSRAGEKLFFKIHTVLTQWRKTRSTKCDTGSNLSNLIEVRTIPVTNKSAHTCQLKCALLNSHSIINEIQDIHIELCTNNINFCALIETWIKEDDMLTLNRMCPKGYDSTSIPRSDKAGGGLAVAYKKDLNVLVQKSGKTNTMEYLAVTLKGDSHESSHNINVIYRPPETKVLSFISDLTDLLESQITSPGPITILGDLNIKVNDKSNGDTINFLDFINTFGLAIQITEPTHRLGNTLDLIITEETSNHIPSVKTDCLFSDHNLVLFDLTSTSTTSAKRTLTFCKIKKINKKFKSGIKQKIGNCQKLDENMLDENLDLYKKALTTTLDDHAPEQTKVVSN